MKHLIIIVSLFLLSLGVQAADSTLADEMKASGEQFRVIALAVRNKAVGNEELKASKALARSMANGSVIYPDTATNDTEKLQYVHWMADSVKKCLELEDAIAAQVGKST